MVDSLLVVLLQLDGDFAATINTLYIDTNFCTHILYNRPFVLTVQQVLGNLFFMCVLRNNLCFIFIHGRIAHHKWKMCVCETATASELDHACMKVWICVSPCFSAINHAIWWLCRVCVFFMHTLNIVLHYIQYMLAFLHTCLACECIKNAYILHVYAFVDIWLCIMGFPIPACIVALGPEG